MAKGPSINLREVNRRLRSRVGADVGAAVKSLREELAQAEAAAGVVTAKEAVLLAAKAAVLVAIVLGIWRPELLAGLNRVWIKAAILGMAVVAGALKDVPLALLLVVLLMVVVLGSPAVVAAPVRAQKQERVPRSILKKDEKPAAGTKAVSFASMSRLNEAPMVELPLVSQAEGEGAGAGARMEKPVGHELAGVPVWTPPTYRGRVDAPPQRALPSPAAQNPVPVLPITDAELGRLAFVSPAQLDAAAAAALLEGGDSEELDVPYPSVNQAPTLLLAS